MPTSYTSLLGLALPVTGELAGTWGDTVNDYISKYVDSSVAGTQTISGSQTAVTLTRANGASLSQAGSGATGSSQYQVINCTGNPAGTLTVTIDVTTGSPTLSNSTYSQTFAVINGTSTSQSVVVRATTTSGTSTGVTLVSGEKALIAWNGSDFIKVATSTVDGVSTISFGTTGLTPSTATSGAVTVAGTLVAANGGTGQSSYTTGDLLYATGSTALSKLGIGASGNYLSSSGTAPQWSAPAALTKTDDTNVTLTLGGSASTALLNAASLTLGWTGQLSIARGGTNATATPTAGAVAYGTGTAYAFTSAGSSGQVLTSGGAGAPTWSSLSSIGVTTFSAGTTGFTPSSATSGAVTLAGTLATTNGGTGLTSFTANGVVYASSSSALTTGSALTFDGANNFLLNASAVSSQANFRVQTDTTGAVANAFFNINGTDYFRIYTTNGETGLRNLQNTSMYFSVNNAEQMRLTSSGLGIGTSSPSAPLHVLKSVAGDWASKISNTNSTNGYGLYVQGAPNASTYLIGAHDGSNYGFVVTGDFKVGIGTSSPAAKLQVANGNILLSNAYYLSARNNANTISISLIGRNTSDQVVIDPDGYGTLIGSGGALNLTSAGNLGLGVTPSSTNYGRWLFIGSAGNSVFGASNDMNMTANAYYNGNWLYGTSTSASRYQQASGQHVWYTAASGTAGDPISFTTAMTLDASGNLMIGATSTSYRLDVVSTAAAGYIVTRINNLSSTGYARVLFDIGANGANGQADISYVPGTFFAIGPSGNDTTTPIVFRNNNATERARITSVGNFSLGTHADRGTTVGTNAIQIFNGTAPAGTLTNGVSLYSSSGDLNFMNSSGNGFKVGYRNLPAVGTQTGSYTLATGDVGKYVQVGSGGSITIPDATFAEGDAVSIFNNTTGNITITCSITTAYIAGTDSDKATMTLATRGVATILFISSTVCVVTGNVT